jgi:PAS domain S-box-containing protein
MPATDDLERSEPVPHGQPGRLDAALTRAETAEAKYRTLIDQLPAVTYSEALDTGKTISVSPQIETILGCTQEEWMADPLMWVKMLHPEDRDRVVEACAESNRTETPFRAEYRMIARDGRVLWFRDHADVVRGSAGQRLCWQGVMFDITALKGTDGQTERATIRPT